MGRSLLAEKPLGANQDRSSWFLFPEVLRTSEGVDVPAVVALCAPLHHFVAFPTLDPNKGVEEDRETRSSKQIK